MPIGSIFLADITSLKLRLLISSTCLWLQPRSAMAIFLGLNFGLI